MNGYNFTERARAVLNLAREEAVRRKHPYVGTEHILLGLLEEGDGVALTALHNLNVDPAGIQRTIDEVVVNGTEPVSETGTLPFTSRSKKVLELAFKEARDLHHQYVGTEHILLGLICEEKGVGAQVLLHNAGLTADKARAEVRRLIESDDSAPGPAIPPWEDWVVAENAETPKWQQDIQALEEKARVAFLAEDAQTLGRLWSDQMLVNSPFNRINNKEEILNLLKKGVIRHSSFEVEIEFMRRHGEIVVVMGNDTITDSPDGPPVRRRFTHVWQAQDESWLLVARHAHIIGPQPTKHPE